MSLPAHHILASKITMINMALLQIRFIRGLCVTGKQIIRCSDLLSTTKRVRFTAETRSLTGLHLSSNRRLVSVHAKMDCKLHANVSGDSLFGCRSFPSLWVRTFFGYIEFTLDLSGKVCCAIGIVQLLVNIVLPAWANGLGQP